MPTTSGNTIWFWKVAVVFLDRDKLTAKRRFCYSGFVTDFVAVISSQSEGLGKIALGIVNLYLGSPFSANRRCPRSVDSRSACRGQLSWTLFRHGQLMTNGCLFL